MSLKLEALARANKILTAHEKEMKDAQKALVAINKELNEMNEQQYKSQKRVNDAWAAMDNLFKVEQP